MRERCSRKPRARSDRLGRISPRGRFGLMRWFGAAPPGERLGCTGQGCRSGTGDNNRRVPSGVLLRIEGRSGRGGATCGTGWHPGRWGAWRVDGSAGRGRNLNRDSRGGARWGADDGCEHRPGRQRKKRADRAGVLVGGESKCSAAPLRPWSATWLLALGGLLAVLVYSAAWDLPAEREVR